MRERETDTPSHELIGLFQSVFGDKLVTSLLFESDFCEDPQLPSPCQLKNKILVKNKKIRDFDTYPLKKVRMILLIYSYINSMCM